MFCVSCDSVALVFVPIWFLSLSHLILSPATPVPLLPSPKLRPLGFILRIFLPVKKKGKNGYLSPGK